MKSASNKVKHCTEHYTGLLFNRQTKELHVNWTRMLFNISPLNFHTGVTRIDTASPLSDSCSDMSVVQPCPHLN